MSRQIVARGEIDSAKHLANFLSGWEPHELRRMEITAGGITATIYRDVRSGNLTLDLKSKARMDDA